MPEEERERRRGGGWGGGGGRATEAEMCEGRFGFSGIQTAGLAVGRHDAPLMSAVTSLALSGGVGVPAD